MRKNKLRVIQISGFRGILSALFVVTCLMAGFIGFPAWSLHKLWNHFAGIYGILPDINIFQGLILWGILAISYTILNKKQKYLVAFESKSSDPREIRNIINQIRTQSANLKKEFDIDYSKPQTMETKDIKVTNTPQEKIETEEKTKEVA